MPFYPKDAPVPEVFYTGDFFLKPLRTTDVELDHAALMDSKEMLRQWSQSGWPPDNFSLSDNLVDLERHEREHIERKAFTFTVLDLDATKCLGCVYIKPLLPLVQHWNVSNVQLAQIRNYEAVVRFWVRQPYLEHNLDERLLNSLVDWFGSGEWAFSRATFLSKDSHSRQVSLYNELGFKLLYQDFPVKLKSVIYG